MRLPTTDATGTSWQSRPISRNSSRSGSSNALPRPSRRASVRRRRLSSGTKRPASNGFRLIRQVTAGHHRLGSAAVADAPAQWFGAPDATGGTPGGCSRSSASTRKAGDPQPASRPPFRPRASPSKASPPSGRAAPATLLDRIPAAGSAHSAPVRERSASPSRYALPQTEWSTGTENFTGISLIA